MAKNKRTEGTAIAAPALPADSSQNIAPVTAMLPLDVPRTITLKGAQKTFSYHFRRITAADWQAFFAAIVHQTLQRGPVRETVYESETAQIELVEKALKTVEGYGDLSGLKNWKTALPLTHRLSVGVVLRNVSWTRSGQPATRVRPRSTPAWCTASGSRRLRSFATSISNRHGCASKARQRAASRRTPRASSWPCGSMTN
jgi:hypothetical protein